MASSPQRPRGAIAGLTCRVAWTARACLNVLGCRVGHSGEQRVHQCDVRHGFTHLTFRHVLGRAVVFPDMFNHFVIDLDLVAQFDESFLAHKSPLYGLDRQGVHELQPALVSRACRLSAFRSFGERRSRLTRKRTPVVASMTYMAPLGRA
jgi:hypothetical protein